MTDTRQNDTPIQAQPFPTPSPTPVDHRGSRLWSQVQFVTCLVLVSGVLAYLLWTAERHSSDLPKAVVANHSQDVQLDRHGRICVRDNCPLHRKLQVSKIQTTPITTPLLTITGTVVGSLRPGNGKGNDYWQFNSPELLTTYTDWQRSVADIAFLETQLTQIEQLAETRISSQEKLVERMKKLVDTGTETEKDLAASQTELIQSRVQGRKEVYEAETAVRLAKREEAALTRQLQQAGLEPDLLQSIASDIDIIMADVPESFIACAKLGQSCEARFFGLPNQWFPGKIRAIAPVLSEERRSLRVLFAINDPHDQLRPGMFADIGLGTDARDALLIPSESVVHVGRSDYVLVRDDHHGHGYWQVTEVQTGELHETNMEIVGGLHAGEEIIGQGAILLKPFIIQALQSSKKDQDSRQTARKTRKTESNPT